MPCILIAKDDETTRHHLQEFLTAKLTQLGLPATFISCGTWASAEEAARSKSFDAVISGESFPKIASGRALYDVIRKAEGKQNTPVIYYTGYPWYREVIATLRNKGDAHIFHVRPHPDGLTKVWETLRPYLTEQVPA